MRDVSRLLNPKSIAIFGGGWGVNVIRQLQKSSFQGQIWPVHPTRTEIDGIPCLLDISALPTPPDASFIGVNRDVTINIVRHLSDIGAGGAVCFASGFLESDDRDGADLQTRLIAAAGNMPILGPNCYGFVNYLDTVPLWPDEHGGCQTDAGVAIIAQSSNIAINMTMQKRGLRLAHMITVGNQAQTSVSDLVETLIRDDRVTVIGLYLEGFGDLHEFEEIAYAAQAAGKTIVALKIGKSEQAQAGTLSHTASLAGSAAASSAFLYRLGIVEVSSIEIFLETLKLIDITGPISGPRISSVSCSGGEASLMADLIEHREITLPAFKAATVFALSEVLGPKVTLANPLDYHTYIWGDVEKMTACFGAVMSDGLDLSVFVLDLPREDLCDPSGHDCAIEAIIAAKQQTGAVVAVLTSLPENLSEAVSRQLQTAGIVPLHGMESGLSAIEASIKAGEFLATPLPQEKIILSTADSRRDRFVVHEYEAKHALAAYGLPLSPSILAKTRQDVIPQSTRLSFPLALKGQGIPHKTEAGAVLLNLQNEEALNCAADQIAEAPSGYLIEEMIADPIAELIIGISRDSTGLLLLTIGAGGIYTEIFQDNRSLILPATRKDIDIALRSLKVFPLLKGYRGKPAANIEIILDAICAIAAYGIAHHATLAELDINPLMVTSNTAIAADALICLYKEAKETLNQGSPDVQPN